MKFDPSRLIEFLNSNMVAVSIGDNYIDNYDLTIQKFERRLVGGPKLIDVFRFNNKFSELGEQYISDILDTSEVKFMNINNFAFDSTRTRLASKDFRVVIDDLKGRVPKNELLHVATICTLMLSGKLEAPIAREHIISFMRKYGYIHFEYSENGYVYVFIDRKTNEFIYRQGAFNQLNRKTGRMNDQWLGLIK